MKYQVVKSKCWPPDEFEYEEVDKPQNKYEDAYSLMRQRVSHLTRLFYGIKIISTGEFVEMPEADYEKAKDESYERAFSPDRVVWG